MKSLIYLGPEYNNKTFSISGSIDIKPQSNVEYRKINFKLTDKARNITIDKSIEEHSTIMLPGNIEYEYRLRENKIDICSSNEVIISLSRNDYGYTLSRVKIGESEPEHIRL